jgi:hypothetical protein
MLQERSDVRPGRQRGMVQRWGSPIVRLGFGGELGERRGTGKGGSSISLIRWDEECACRKI